MVPRHVLTRYRAFYHSLQAAASQMPRPPGRNKKPRGKRGRGILAIHAISAKDPTFKAPGAPEPEETYAAKRGCERALPSPSLV